MRTGFEEFELSSQGGILCFREKCGDLLLIHGPEALHCLKRLVQNCWGVDPGDHNRCRRVQSEVQGLRWRHCLAFEDEVISEGLHGKNGCAALLRNRRNSIQKRTEMRIHHVDRHLHSVEMKGVLVGSLKHAQMYAGILMTRESDVADLARLFRLLNSLDGSARCKDHIRIVETNDLVELQEVD